MERKLSRLEIASIAALADNYGFQLVLDALQAEHDDLLDEIAAGVATDKLEQTKLGEWRAYRKLLGRIRHITTAFAQEYTEALAKVDPDKPADNSLAWEALFSNFTNIDPSVFDSAVDDSNE